MMAQGRVEEARFAGQSAAKGLAEHHRHAIQQYEKIVRFQDAVLSGNHPSIKISPSLIASAQSSILSTRVPIPTGSKTHQQENSQSTSANSQQPSVPSGSFPGAAAVNTPSAAKPYGSGSTEINPILLEKSDDLIKAELQLQRQRLERALREEVDQRRIAARTSGQAEPLADFDLSDVLSKALTLVQATAAPLPADENVTAANDDAASDSFDDNTFYSSQHNTPESPLISRVRNESNEAQTAVDVPESQPSPSNPRAGALSRDPPRIDSQSGNLASQPPRAYKSHPDPSATTPSYATSGVTQVPGLNEPLNGGVVSSGPSQSTSGAPSQSEESANMEIDQQGQGPSSRRHPVQRHNDSYTDSRPPSPLVRGHNLSPYAPQPSHVSQLAVPGRLAPAAEQLPSPATGTPAQVAALRNEPNAGTSPESSSQSGRPSDKRKGKKKKRKADRQVPEPDAPPYIKPEPRSPSPPMAAPSYARPSKRQRYTQRQPNESDYEAAEYEARPDQVQAEPYSTHPAREARIPIGYVRDEPYPPRSASAAVVGSSSYGREYIDDRRIIGDPYVPGQPSHSYAVEYSGGPQPAGLMAPSRVDDPYRESPRSHRETYEVPPMSVRPEGEAYMRPPPRPQPTRIVVDAYGREYFEPPRPTIVRQSVAPPVRHGEPEIIYERAAPRALSRHPGVEAYEEGGVVYRRPSPTYAMPRRVVTQPEYISQEYRGAQHQEYSARPLAAPPGEYVEVMAPLPRRFVEDAPRDYVARSASVRPVESVRYDAPHEYGRVQSVRPEAAVRQYTASVHPETRRDAGHPYVREYEPRPGEQPIVRQEYSVRPAERYYEPPLRGGEEIAFIERPRGSTQEIVYADDARREVYR